jgi:hypothetical protein
VPPTAASAATKACYARSAVVSDKDSIRPLPTSGPDIRLGTRRGRREAACGCDTETRRQQEAGRSLLVPPCLLPLIIGASSGTFHCIAPAISTATAHATASSAITQAQVFMLGLPALA